jgi:hypothetical protein
MSAQDSGRTAAKNTANWTVGKIKAPVRFQGIGPVP